MSYFANLGSQIFNKVLDTVDDVLDYDQDEQSEKFKESKDKDNSNIYKQTYFDEFSPESSNNVGDSLDEVDLNSTTANMNQNTSLNVSSIVPTTTNKYWDSNQGKYNSNNIDLDIIPSAEKSIHSETMIEVMTLNAIPDTNQTNFFGFSNYSVDNKSNPQKKLFDSPVQPPYALSAPSSSNNAFNVTGTVAENSTKTNLFSNFNTANLITHGYNAVNVVENVLKSSHETVKNITNNQMQDPNVVEIDPAEAEATIARLLADNSSMEEKLVSKNKELSELRQTNEKLTQSLSSLSASQKADSVRDSDYKQSIATIKQQQQEIEFLKKNLECEISSSNNKLSDMIIAEQDSFKHQIDLKDNENLKLLNQLKDANAAITHLESIVNNKVNNNNNENMFTESSAPSISPNKFATYDSDTPDMTNIIQSLENQKKDLQNKLSELTSANESQAIELVQMKSYIQDFELRLRESEEVAWKAKAEQAELIHAKEHLEDLIKKFQNQEQILLQQLQSLQASYNELTLTRQTDIATTQSVQSQERILQQQLQSLQASYDELTLTRQSDVATMQNLQSQSQTLMQQLESLQASYDELTLIRQSDVATIQNLQSQEQTLMQQLESLQASYDELILIRQSDVATIQNLQSQEQTLIQQLVTLKDNHAELISFRESDAIRIENLQTQLEAAIASSTLSNSTLNGPPLSNSFSSEIIKTRIKLIDIYNKLEKLILKMQENPPSPGAENPPSLENKSVEDLLTYHIIPQIKTLAHEYQKIKKDFNVAKQSILQSTQSTNQPLSLELESLKSEIERLTQENHQLHQIAQTTASQITLQTIDNTEINNSHYIPEATAIITNAANCENNIQQNEKISSLLNTLSEYEQQIKALKSLQTELEMSTQSEKMALERSLQELSTQVVQLQQSNQNKEATEKEYKDRYESISAQFNTFKQQANKYEIENKQLHQVITQLREVRKAGKQDVDAVINERDELKLKCQKYEQDINKLHHTVSSSVTDSAQFSKMERDLKSSIEYIKSLESNVEQLKSENVHLEKQLYDKTKDVSITKTDVSLMQQDLEQRNLEIYNLKVALDNIQKSQELEEKRIAEHYYQQMKQKQIEYELNVNEINDSWQVKLDMQNEQKAVLERKLDDEMLFRRKAEIDMNTEKRRMAKTLDSALKQLQNSREDVVDRALIANLIVNYFHRNRDKDILGLIAKILSFNDDQKEIVGLQPVSLIASILTTVVGKPPPPLDIEGDNLAELWVNFLLVESESAKNNGMLSPSSSHANSSMYEENHSSNSHIGNMPRKPSHVPTPGEIMEIINSSK